MQYHLRRPSGPAASWTYGEILGNRIALTSREVGAPEAEMAANSGDLGVGEVKEESSSLSLRPFDGAEDIDPPLGPSSKR